MTNPPSSRVLRLILPLLAALLPVGADPVPPSLSQVVIIPASAGTPPSFTGVVTGGPPNGTVWLQASLDVGVAYPWTNIATTALDNLGSATFTNIPDPRPQAANAKWNFYRAATNVVSLGQMVFIPGGTFQMGDALDGLSNAPVHSVYVSGFYLQNTEVTKGQWNAVANWAAANGYNINTAGGSGKAASHPVYNVTWYEVVKYCNARSQMENLTPCYTVGGATYKTGSSAPDCNWNASGYRLPSEAEWEKAARGGLSGKRFPWGDIINLSYANYYNSNESYESPQNQGYNPIYDDGVNPYTSPVGSFPANGYGLYDMAGNFSEWCWDWYGSSFYSTSPGTDPRGPASGTYRVFRGGDWLTVANGSRTALRNYDTPGYSSSVGFRPARTSVP